MQLDDAVLDMPFDFFLSFHFDHTQFQKYIESVKSNMVQIQAKLYVCSCLTSWKLWKWNLGKKKSNFSAISRALNLQNLKT